MKSLQLKARQIVADELARKMSGEKLGVADRLLLDRFVIPEADSNLGFIEYIEAASAGATRYAGSFGFAI